MIHRFSSSGLPIVVLVVMAAATMAYANTAPTVSNVVANQRPGTFLVDLTYDLADPENDVCTVTFLLSTDAGLTYPVQLVSLVGDAGTGQMPATGKTVVWDAGADFPEYFGTECSIRVVADDSVPAVVDLIVLLDRSGSMSGTKFSNATAEMGDFFQAPGTANVSAGLSFFPVGDVPDECDQNLYNPPQEALRAIPAQASGLITAMNGQVAAGSASNHTAFYGSMIYATEYKDANPERTLAIVLVADGGATICETSNMELVVLAQSGFNYNGVLTYVVALEGAIPSDFNAIAAAGGTSTAYNLTEDIFQLSEVMAEIAANAGAR